MSRFSGPQGDGAQRLARETRMYQAYLRQVDGRRRGVTVRGEGWFYADPAEFLSRDAAAAVAADRVNVESYRRPA